MTTRGSTKQMGPMYHLCQRCEQRHLGDCSTMTGRCYICRGKGIDGGTASIWEEVSFVGK